jgi:hypothetical protein
MQLAICSKPLDLLQQLPELSKNQTFCLLEPVQPKGQDPELLKERESLRARPIPNTRMAAPPPSCYVSCGAVGGDQEQRGRG